MRILSQTPVPIAEVKSYVKDFEDRKPFQDYLKKFSKLSKEKAEALSKDIHALNNPKIKQSHIVKIADFVPKNTEQLNKIFIDVSLSEEEANAITGITSKY